MDIPPEQLEICLKVLQQISDEPRLIDQHDRLKNLIAKIYQKNRKISRRAKRKEDRKLKETAVMIQNQFEQAGVCVYLTDGFGSFPSDIPELPVLWVVTPGGLDLKQFPFGEAVRLLSR